MRGPSRWLALGTITLLLSSCHHWYTRGAMAIGGAAAIGYGGGSLLPCTMDEPDCHGSNATGGAIVMASTALFLWGITELVFAIGPTGDDYDSDYSSGGGSSGDDDSSGGSSSGDDDSSGDSGDGSADSSDDGGTDCHSVTVDPGVDGAQEYASGGTAVSAYGTSQQTTPLEACDAAKESAFMTLRTQCGAFAEPSRLNEWIVYHQSCDCWYCPQGEVGAIRASCHVTVTGVCTPGATQRPEFGYAIEDTRAYAIEVATTNARGLCNGVQGEVSVLGCDTEAADRGTETVTVYACAVSVDCMP